MVIRNLADHFRSSRCLWLWFLDTLSWNPTARIDLVLYFRWFVRQVFTYVHQYGNFADRPPKIGLEQPSQGIASPSLITGGALQKRSSLIRIMSGGKKLGSTHFPSAAFSVEVRRRVSRQLTEISLADG